MQTAQFQLHAEIEERHWWFVARRRIVGRLANAVVPPARENLVIDVGCGTGANLSALARQYDCLGIDTAADAIDRARQRFPEVRFVQGWAPQDLGESVAQARLILMMDVLEHVPDDFTVFSAILAATTPGTQFLITVPADNALWSQHDVSFGHYRRYDRPRLERVWQGLPVRVRLLSAFNARLYWLIRAIRTWNRWRGKAGGVAGTDFQMPAPPVNRLLERFFAGEARRLLGLLDGKRGKPYPHGASLIAILQREPGEVAVRTKPADLPPDRK